VSSTRRGREKEIRTEKQGIKKRNSPLGPRNISPATREKAQGSARKKNEGNIGRQKKEKRKSTARIKPDFVVHAGGEKGRRELVSRGGRT